MSNPNWPACDDGTCPSGAHEIVRPGRQSAHCRYCGRHSDSIHNWFNEAAAGDFRVVCTESDCDYGDHTDAHGDGYTNHGHIELAKAALQRHQTAVSDESGDDRHAARIQQHPVEAVIAAEADAADDFPNDDNVTQDTR